MFVVSLSLCVGLLYFLFFHFQLQLVDHYWVGLVENITISCTFYLHSYCLIEVVDILSCISFGMGSNCLCPGLCSIIMNQSPGVNSGQRLRCFISWKRVASARRQTLVVAVMLQWVNENINNNLWPLRLYVSPLCSKETCIFLRVLMVQFPLQPSETPPSKKQKKSVSKTKKITSFYFDSATPPQSVCWVQTDTSADTWTPYCNGGMVPGNRRQEWDAVFLSVSKLKRRNTHTGR